MTIRIEIEIFCLIKHWLSSNFINFMEIRIKTVNILIFLAVLKTCKTQKCNKNILILSKFFLFHQLKILHKLAQSAIEILFMDIFTRSFNQFSVFSMSPTDFIFVHTQNVIEYDGLVIYAFLKSTFNQGKSRKN